MFDRWRREPTRAGDRAAPAAASEGDWGDLQKVLEGYGYAITSTKGSHCTFRKKGAAPIPVPVHSGKVKRVYIHKVFELLGLNDS